MDYKFKLSNFKNALIANSGFGLIELIIAVSLLLIVLIISFMFYSFGIATFAQGERQADVQQNARLAGDFISEEVRVAERMIILDDYDGHLDEVEVKAINDIVEEGLEKDYSLYFIYLEDGSIYHQKIEDVTEPAFTSILEGISEKIDFQIDYTISDSREDILSFELVAEDKETDRDYSFKTEVLVLNLEQIEDETSDGTGTAIFYRIPDPPSPAIKTIRMNRYNHVYGSEESTDKLDITAYTSNVADQEGVRAEFIKLKDDESLIIEDVYDEEEISDNRADLQLYLEDQYFGYYVVHVKSVEDNFSSQRRYYYIAPDIKRPVIKGIGNSRNQDYEIQILGISEEEAEDMEIVIGNYEQNNDTEGDILIKILDEEGELLSVEEVIHEPEYNEGIIHFRHRLEDAVDIDEPFNVEITIAETIKEFEFGRSYIDSINVSDDTVTIKTFDLEYEEKPVEEINLYTHEADQEIIDNFKLIDVDDPDKTLGVEELEVDENGEIKFRLELTEASEDYYGEELIIEVKIEGEIIQSEEFTIED